MVLAAQAALGLTMRFRVRVDDVDLGGWSTCTGLAVDFTSHPVPSGGDYGTQTVLPDRVEYAPVTLRRAMVRAESAQVQAWLASVVDDWYGGSDALSGSGRTARIVLLDAATAEVASWSLRDVRPRGWRGPDLDANGHGVALETLQLVHQGFL